MSALPKLLHKPLRVAKRVLMASRSRGAGKPPVFVVGFSTWKKYMRQYFADYDLIFLPKAVSETEFQLQYRALMLKARQHAQVFIWGFKVPPFLHDFLQQHQFDVRYVEDGFIRSVKLGATKAPPMSLCLDSQTPYFDATRPSDLEQMLSTYDFDGQQPLLERAQKAIALLLETGISKYNNAAPVNVQRLYGEKKRRRILVLGQVEDDASIQYGCDRSISNNDVVRLAVQENPDAQVIYKPHPDVLHGHRPYQSDPKQVAHLCLVLTEDLALSHALETVDQVYTISSLSGFEALLRGIAVTVLGCPFYAGWGLTDDRQPNARRRRKLSIEQLFAVAYLLYPKYFDPATGQSITLEDTIALLQAERAKIQPALSAAEEPRSLKSKAVKGKLLKLSEQGDGRRALLFGFGHHKLAFYVGQLTDYSVFSLDLAVKDQVMLSAEQVVQLFQPRPDDLVLFWGKKDVAGLEQAMRARGVDIGRVEDAFVRSVGLGNMQTSPLSYIVDKRGIYFDAEHPSELEDLLNHYDFAGNPALLQRAEAAMARIIASGTSKYNYAEPVDVSRLYGQKDRPRILVLGQVEDDASILYGCRRTMTNNDLVILARMENPDAQIIYKPHPDVLTGLRARKSDPAMVASIATVVTEPLAIADALQTVDRVYTMTSLSGFEALMRGIPVTALGAPFYAGWGLTDDRHPCPRRQRKLTVLEVFAAAYLLYSRYVNPYSRQPIELEQALDLLQWMKQHPIPAVEPAIAGLASSQAVKVRQMLDTGDLGGALQGADILVASQGDAAAYLQRAKARLQAGRIGPEVAQDFHYACQLSAWKDKGVLRAYARYLWEFQGFNKVLHQVAAKLSRLPQLTAQDSLMLASIFVEGGYFQLAEDCLAQLELQPEHLPSCSLVLARYLGERLPGRLIRQLPEATTLWQQLAEGTAAFEAMIRSKDFCFVGNAPSELGRGQGARIDAFAQVIRFNAFDTSYPYQQDYGSKTTVWVRMPRQPGLHKERLDGMELVLLSGSNLPGRMPDGYLAFASMQQYPALGVVPFEVYRKLCQELGAAPSAGLQLLYWAYSLIGPLSAEQVFGFSLSDQRPFQNSHYAAHSLGTVRHDWQKERALFERLVQGSSQAGSSAPASHFKQVANE